MIEKCKCQHCDTRIEFEAEHARETVDCPNCKMPTTLFIPTKSVPPPEFSFPKNELKKSNTVMMFAITVPATIVAIVIVGLLLKNGSPSVIEKERIVYITNSPLPHLFEAYKNIGSMLEVEQLKVKMAYEPIYGQYVFGKIANTLQFSLENVEVEINELDRNGNVIGSVMDSISGLNPEEQWNIKIRVGKECVSARVSKITAYKSENSGN